MSDVNKNETSTKKPLVVNITKEDFKAKWLDFLLLFKLPINMTPREKSVFLAFCEYKEISTTERKEVAAKLEVSMQVITNCIQKFKEKSLLEVVPDTVVETYKIKILDAIPTSPEWLESVVVRFKAI